MQEFQFRTSVFRIKGVVAKIFHKSGLLPVKVKHNNITIVTNLPQKYFEKSEHFSNKTFLSHY